MNPRVQLKELLRHLEGRYGARRRGRTRKVLDELLLVLLAHDLDEGPGHSPGALPRQVLELLTRHYVDWNHARVAQPSEIARLIAAAGLRLAGPAPVTDRPTPAMERAARRLLEVLRQIHALRGVLDLESYTGIKLPELRRFLEGLPAIRRDEHGQLLLYAFRANLMPVDEDHLRVLLRTGVVPRGTTRPQASRRLQELLDPGRLYSAYRLLAEHAARTCAAAEPSCPDCVLRRSCPAARRFIREREHRERQRSREAAAARARTAARKASG